MRSVILSIIFLIIYITINAQSPPIIYVAGDGSGDYNCDGTSDQVEINQALDFVAADSNYTTVYLKGPNTFWINEPIYISANTILEGDSNAIIKLVDHARWNTQFKPLIGQKGLTFTFQLGDPSTTTGNITIRGFEIDGNRDHQNEPSGNSFYNAIRLQNCYNITINDMYMHHNLADMVQITNDEFGFDINSQFYNNRIHKNGHDAFFFGFVDNFQVFNNNITNHRTDAGVRTDACNHFQIYNNIIGNDPDRDPSGGAAIEIYAWGQYPVNDVEIYGNYLYGNGDYHGIWLNQRDDDNPAGTLHTHEDVHIHHNIISWYQLAGIAITGFHNTLIENNVIELNEGGGVVFYGGDPVDSTISGFQTILKNNIIVNNTNYGIDNRAPSVHSFISDHNDVYRNSIAHYHNASSTADIHTEPEFAYQDTFYYNTYGNNTYSILSPAWQSAKASQNFSGDLGANEAWMVYHPRSQYGRWDGSHWVNDTITSQCIDRGDPAADFSNEPIPNGDRINLGAYGNTITASKNEVPIVKIQCKIFLEGAYNATNDEMNDNINSDIPTTSPYVENPRTVESIPPNIVDWVLVELRTGIDASTTVISKSVFLHKNGKVVADDGTTGEIELAASEGSYFIVIKHRNHLAVMSKNPVPLNGITSTLYDFTTGSDKFYGTGGAKQLK